MKIFIAMHRDQGGGLHYVGKEGKGVNLIA